MLWPMGLAASVASACTAAVCMINAYAYGWFGTVEFRAAEYTAAYGSLTRVDVGPFIPRVPVTRAAREAVYQVSPAFAELRPFLEGFLGEAWARNSVYVTQLDPSQREIAGGWWMWALRDAAADAGHMRSAREALAFYQRIADEVNAACDQGKLAAHPRRDTMLPPWRPEYTAHLKQDLPDFFRYFGTFDGFNVQLDPSVGDPQSLQLFRDLTQWHLSNVEEPPERQTPYSTAARAYRIRTLHYIGHTLRWGCALLVLAGVAAWMWSLLRAAWQRRLPGYLWWFASACLGAAGGIVLINLLVHVTSFPNLSPGAFAQGYPVIVLFGVVAAADAFASRLRPSEVPASVPDPAPDLACTT
jgi:hypothetical protein